MTTYLRDVPVTSAATAAWNLKVGLLAASVAATNWTIRSSGCRGLYAQSGDVVDSEDDELVASTWWVARGHGLLDSGAVVRQELCVQVDGAGGWRVKVSPRAGFTGGSPSATRVPSAADERVWWGGGTDASPTYQSIFPTSGAWLQGRFDEGSDAAWLMAYPVGGGLPSALLVLGCFQVTYDGVGGLVDRAPWAYFAGSGGSCSLAQGGWASESAGPLGVLSYGQVSGSTALDAWVRLPASQRAVYDSSGTMVQSIPGHIPQSATGASAQEVMRLSRRSELAGVTNAGETGNLNTCGDKGELLGVRYSGRRFTVPTLLDTVTASGASRSTAALGVGDLVLPWEAGYSVRDGA